MRRLLARVCAEFAHLADDNLFVVVASVAVLVHSGDISLAVSVSIASSALSAASVFDRLAHDGEDARRATVLAKWQRRSRICLALTAINLGLWAGGAS